MGDAECYGEGQQPLDDSIAGRGLAVTGDVAEVLAEAAPFPGTPDSIIRKRRVCSVADQSSDADEGERQRDHHGPAAEAVGDEREPYRGHPSGDEGNDSNGYEPRPYCAAVFIEQPGRYHVRLERGLEPSKVTHQAASRLAERNLARAGGPGEDDLEQPLFVRGQRTFQRCCGHCEITEAKPS